MVDPAASGRPGRASGLLVSLGTASVVDSWLVVHTVFMLRYACNYCGEPTGVIEFETFQVSETNITGKAIGFMALHHALLSYLFGAVILAAAINVFASLWR